MVGFLFPFNPKRGPNSISSNSQRLIQSVLRIQPLKLRPVPQSFQCFRVQKQRVSGRVPLWPKATKWPPVSDKDNPQTKLLSPQFHCPMPTSPPRRTPDFPSWQFASRSHWSKTSEFFGTANSSTPKVSFCGFPFLVLFGLQVGNQKDTGCQFSVIILSLFFGGFSKSATGSVSFNLSLNRLTIRQWSNHGPRGSLRQNIAHAIHLSFLKDPLFWAALRSPAKSLTFSGLNGNHH